VAALDLETDLRARWIAAGQTAESFPGREDWQLADRAPWEIAQLVLALIARPTGVAADRWSEIAQAISASDLGHELSKIGDYQRGGAVDTLVRAGLPYWTAQYAYVPPLESDSMSGFDWAFGSYALEIGLVRRRAFFTDLGRKWSRVPRTTNLPRARARLDALTNPNVLGVGIITPEENISHELRPTATASLGTRLQPYIDQEVDAAWRAARITWLELRVPGTGAAAHVDFDRSVVRTTEPVPLRTYVLLVAEFVAGLDMTELEELQEHLDRPVN
jgi:hypothetical protein